MASDTIREAAPALRQSAQRAEPGIQDTETTGFAPHTIGGIFDESFDLYKRHFASLALIVACVFIPTQVILHAAGNLWLRPLIAQSNGANPDPLVLLQVTTLGFVTGAPQFGLPGYLSLLTSFMASGPLAVAVANILVGRPLSVATAYRRAVPVFWRLFWMWNLLLVLFLLVFVVIFIGLFLALIFLIFLLSAAGVNPNALGAQEIGVAVVILMIVVPYLASCGLGALFFAFAPPMIALENLTVTGAVERNSRLVSRELFWRVTVAVTLLPIVIFGLQILILASASSLVEALKWPAWAAFVANTGLSSLISFFFQPYWMIFITLLYFDTRVRREGLDVRYLVDNLTELDPLLDHSVARPNPQGQPASSRPEPDARRISIAVPPMPAQGPEVPDARHAK